MQTWRAISFPNTGGVRVSPCTLGMDYLHPDGHTLRCNDLLEIHAFGYVENYDDFFKIFYRYSY